jgi:hypothetical protein
MGDRSVRRRRSPMPLLISLNVVRSRIVRLQSIYRSLRFVWAAACYKRPKVDMNLICIAGDLLDMFKSESRTEQASEVSRTITSPDVCNLAESDGGGPAP